MAVINHVRRPEINMIAPMIITRYFPFLSMISEIKKCKGMKRFESFSVKFTLSVSGGEVN